ncbi:MAG TPA: hypothetical protein VIL86_11180 [Tepidisphaeraceae bacterium]|jgi:hypothetical protein
MPPDTNATAGDVPARTKSLWDQDEVARWLNRGEWAVAIAVTLFLILLHVHGAFSFGALWRDEVNSVNVATMPTWSQVWRWKEFDSYPMLWFVILRIWQVLAGASDTSWRVLGALMGVTSIGALWWSARRMGYTIPLISLTLLAMNPSVLRWGDSMRAYGIGATLVVVTFAATWSALQSPTRRRLALAAVCSILCAQALYLNAVFLAAIQLAAIAVALRRRQWKLAATFAAIGAVAAASLLPYLPTIVRTSHWNMLLKLDSVGGLIWVMVSTTAGGGSTAIFWLWVVLPLAAVGAALFLILRKKRSGDVTDLAIYCMITLGAGAKGFFWFLSILSYPTHPWYYLGLLTIMCITTETFLLKLVSLPKIQFWRLALAAIIALILWNKDRSAMDYLQTDLDLVAHQVESVARSDDLVVIMPWYFGITFSRYYHGPAAFLTVPPVSDHRTHRYDLFKEFMVRDDPLRELKDEITNTLKSGKRVIVVGSVDIPFRGAPDVSVPVAPDRNIGWGGGTYEAGWSLQTARFLRVHATKAWMLPAYRSRPVSNYEHAVAAVYEGWRRDPATSGTARAGQ